MIFFFQVILVLGDEKDPNKGIKGVIDIDDDDDDDFGSMMFKGSSGSAGKQNFFRSCTVLQVWISTSKFRFFSPKICIK